MDLLASSGSLVPAAAARKAVRTWVAQRQFGGDTDGQFSAAMGTVGGGGQIWPFSHHVCALVCVIVEGK